MMQRILLPFFMLFYIINMLAQSLKPIEITDEWLASIENLAPSKTTITTDSKKKILVFSKATGFDHWTIPHNIEMLKILARKSNAFEIHIGYDIENFDKKNLRKYDAVILNNSNPSGPDRDLFSDLLKQNTTLTPIEIKEKAATYE